MTEFTGQTALITGASRGIGRAIALALAREGANVIVHYRHSDQEAETLAAELRGRAVQADLSSSNGVHRLLDSLKSAKFDILVNNAGIWKPTPLGATEEDDVRLLLEVNLHAVFSLTNSLLPQLNRGARIVNISSVAGRVGIAGGRSIYGATKAAIDSLTKSWALELAPRDIRVNAVAPGYVESDMTAKYFDDPAVLERAIQRSPFHRIGNVDEVADAVVFLCSQQSRWITGQSLNVSGGFVI
jgi:3-oxoacyl-[acyl-carrier protein] reductase